MSNHVYRQDCYIVPFFKQNFNIRSIVTFLVPYGSVLGLALFPIYVNDLAQLNIAGIFHSI